MSENDNRLSHCGSALYCEKMLERIREANDYAKQNRLSGFAISSPYYGLADQIEDPCGGNRKQVI